MYGPSTSVDAGDHWSAGNWNALRREANSPLSGAGVGGTTTEGHHVGTDSTEVLELYEDREASALDTQWQQHKGMGRPVTLRLSPKRFTLHPTQTREEPLWLPTDEQINDVGQGALSLTVGQRVWTTLWHDKRAALVTEATGRPYLKWACVTTGGYNNKSQFTNGVPDDVAVQSCDIDGANIHGDTFLLKVPRRPNKDPALFGGDVVGYQRDRQGNDVVVTDCYDNPFYVVKWEGVDVANIRNGWRLCNGQQGTPDLSARFIMCVDEDGDEGMFENHVGVPFVWSRLHKHVIHPDHHHSGTSLSTSDDLTGSTAGGPGHEHTISDVESSVWLEDHSASSIEMTSLEAVDRTHAYADHRPRYYIMAAIIRCW